MIDDPDLDEPDFEEPDFDNLDFEEPAFVPSALDDTSKLEPGVVELWMDRIWILMWAPVTARRPTKCWPIDSAPATVMTGVR